MGYTHGTRWTDEEITEKIIEIVKFSHLDRMPTRKEVEQYLWGHVANQRHYPSQGRLVCACRENAIADKGV